MLRYYIKYIPNADPWKPKVMKFIYTQKVAFNIKGMNIHSALVILLNNVFNKLKALNDEKRDKLVKNND
jgi:hypothetical protein